MKNTYTLEELNRMVEEANERCGSLYLSSLTSIPEGFNPTVGGWLDLSSLTSIPEGFNPTVGGSLYLSSLTSIPEGFNPTVGGSLYLSSLTSIPEGFNPTVGGSLYLRSLTSIPEGFNPTVGGWLDLRSLTSIPEGFNPTVGGSLYLSSLTSIPEGFNPTVGGSLYLSSLTSIPEGFNPTVGGSLYLRSLTSIPEGFNPTVGSWLDLRSGWQHISNIKDGTYVSGKYIYCDGILTHVKRTRKYGEYTFYIGKIPNRHVVSDGTYYAHCKSFKEGVEDIAFKRAKERGAEQYKELSLDSTVTKEEAIQMYRIITGACRQGTESFLATIKKFKKEYTVRELIEITKGQYNAAVFADFFEKEDEQ